MEKEDTAQEKQNTSDDATLIAGEHGRRLSNLGALGASSHDNAPDSSMGCSDSSGETTTSSTEASVESPAKTTAKDSASASSRIANRYLVEQAIRGDNEALEQVIRLYYRDILYFAIKKVGAQEGEDLAQKAISNIIVEIKNLKDPERFKSWMISIVYHDCADYLRRMKRARGLLVDEGDIGEGYLESLEDADSDLMPEVAFIKEENRQIILEIIDTLPENYADCIRLRYYEGLSNTEIAEVLGVDERKVRNDIHRAHHRLQKLYMEKTGEKHRFGAVASASALATIFEAEKAELVTSDAAFRVLGAVTKQLTVNTSAAAVSSVAGASIAKIVAGSISALVVAGGVIFAINQGTAGEVEQPAPIVEEVMTVESEPVPAIEAEPELRVIETAADLIGDDNFALLEAYTANGTDEATWRAFLESIGADPQDRAFEPRYTYALSVVSEQDKQLLLADRVSTETGATEVLWIFRQIEELPDMFSVILMFP